MTSMKTISSNMKIYIYLLQLLYFKTIIPKNIDQIRYLWTFCCEISYNNCVPPIVLSTLHLWTTNSRMWIFCVILMFCWVDCLQPKETKKKKVSALQMLLPYVHLVASDDFGICFTAIMWDPDKSLHARCIPVVL